MQIQLVQQINMRWRWVSYGGRKIQMAIHSQLSYGTPGAEAVFSKTRRHLVNKGIVMRSEDNQ